jgi:hypothetical protein
MKVIWKLPELDTDTLHMGAGWRVTHVDEPTVYLRVLNWDMITRMLTVTAERPGWYFVLIGYRLLQSVCTIWIGFVMITVRLAEVWGLGRRKAGVYPTLRQVYSIDWLCRQFERKAR